MSKLRSRPGAALAAVVLLVVVWAILRIDPENPPGLAIFFGRFHPLIVHLPIGFLIVAFLMEVVGRSSRFERVKGATPFVLLLSAISAVAAVAAGYLLAMGGAYDESLLFWHKRLGIAVAMISVLAYGLKMLTLRRPTLAFQRAYTGALIAAMGILTVASHLGGSLTHGSDYLTEYLPEPVRYAMALAPREDDRPQIVNIDEAVIYRDLVHPILEAKCTSCHGADKQKGELRLDTPEGIQEGGDDGPVISAGRALDSELIKRVWLPADHDDHMPPKGRTPLTIAEAELIRWWIDSGASFEQTVADVNVPDGVQTILDQIAGPRVGAVTGILAQEMPPANPTDIATVERLGVAVSPLSGNTGFLQVHATNVARRFGNNELASLKPLAQQLTWLDLGGTQITDSGLVVLRDLKHLTRLHLERTAITDAGLAHLSGLEHLRYLNLYGTKVTDAGLKTLASLTELRSLYLWQTDVTEAGVEALQAQLPRLEVSRGLTLPQTDSAATDSAGPVRAASLAVD